MTLDVASPKLHWQSESAPPHGRFLACPQGQSPRAGAPPTPGQLGAGGQGAKGSMKSHPLTAKPENQA